MQGTGEINKKCKGLEVEKDPGEFQKQQDVEEGTRG